MSDFAAVKELVEQHVVSYRLSCSKRCAFDVPLAAVGSCPWQKCMTTPIDLLKLVGEQFRFGVLVPSSMAPLFAYFLGQT